MPSLPPSTIGDAYTTTFAWNVLDNITSVGNRMPGHPGEADGARVMRDALEQAGATDAETVEFDIPGWWRGDATLTITTPDGRDTTYDAPVHLIGLPGTPDTTVTAELIDLDAGLPDDYDHPDLDGRIALVGSQNPATYGRGINRIEKYARAAHAGATGFIYHNATTPGAVPPTGAIGFAHDFPAPIPAVGASKELGAHLTRALTQGSVTATLETHADTGTATSHTATATLGPDTPDEVLVTAHIDAHDLAHGARDNAAGCTLVAATARILASLEDDLDIRVRFLAFGAEETGLFGSTHWADTHDPGSIAAQINLDGIGTTRTLGVTGLGLLDAFDALNDPPYRPVHTTPDASPFNDHWPFVTRGVPSVTCRSATPDTGQVVRYGHREWGHTHADTIDKIDPRDLRDLSIQIATATHHTATTTPPDRVPSEAVQDAIHPDLADYLRFDDRWPW